MAYKAMVLAQSKDYMNSLPTAQFFGQPLFKGLFLFALFYWLTRERVYQLFETQLFSYDIILNLILDIGFYHFLVSSHYIDIIPGAPELSVSILILQIRMSIENHQ